MSDKCANCKEELVQFGYCCSESCANQHIKELQSKLQEAEAVRDRDWETILLYN